MVGDKIQPEIIVASKLRFCSQMTRSARTPHATWGTAARATSFSTPHWTGIPPSRSARLDTVVWLC